jgi:hypothetical protein
MGPTSAVTNISTSAREEMLGVLMPWVLRPLDGRRQLAITSRIIERFFDVYLKGNGTSLSLAMPEYPELTDARPPG